jgi:lipoate-protein ligase A
LLELTLPTTRENLALDEWLLEWCDSSDVPRQVLRLWENPMHAVVLGRGSRLQDEVHADACAARAVEVVRRVSGGASVVIGPGCLMYSLVLDCRIHGELRMLDAAHRFVMLRMKDALSAAGAPVEFQGTCDLTWEGRKVSGNAVRVKQNAMLYHGTILYRFALNLISECLGTPPRQPEYRDSRVHSDFVANVPLSRELLCDEIIRIWAANAEKGAVGQVCVAPKRSMRGGEEIDSRPATAPVPDWVDRGAVNRLVQTRYSDPAWTRGRGR